MDLGYFAWIWAIQFGFGPQRRQSPEDGAGGDGRTYVRTDGRTDSPYVLQDFVPFGAAAQKAKTNEESRRKESCWIFRITILEIELLFFDKLNIPECALKSHFKK